MPENLAKRDRIALFIDADNVPARCMPAIMRELTGKYGDVTYRRAYANWLKPSTAWKGMIERYSLRPVFQAAGARGKNSADIGLAIDAMDALYAGTAECFCIASSDSDYTALAVRLREGGKEVIGIGERDKVRDDSPLARACSRFLFVENLLDDDAGDAQDLANAKEAPATGREAIQDVIVDIIVASSGDAGEMNLSQLKEALTARRPDFDERTYGFSSFSKFIASLDGLEVVPAGAPVSVKVSGGDARTRQVFELIRDRVEQAGPKGCTQSEISGAISAAFPGQRIRALGYTRMRKLLEDVPGIYLDKRHDGTVIAKPEE